MQKMVPLCRTVKLSSGYRMPVIGLGTWQTDSEDSVYRTLNSAVDAGYRLIDTAVSYGNERFIGSALRQIIQSGKIKREDLFVVTKLPPNGLNTRFVEHFFRRSLSELHLDYIDLYLIHFPVATMYSGNDEEIFPLENDVLVTDSSVNITDTWKVMESLVDRGLAKSIGLANFNSKQIQRIYNAARIKPANLQVEFHAYLPQFELMEFCQKMNIAMTAYSPLGSPGLAKYAFEKYGVLDYNPDVLLDDPRVTSISKKYTKTPAQILLRYLIQRGINAIPKSSNDKRLKENIQIFDFSLDDEDMKTLKSMARNFRYFTFDFFKGMKDHPEHPFHEPF